MTKNGEQQALELSQSLSNLVSNPDWNEDIQVSTKAQRILEKVNNLDVSKEVLKNTKLARKVKKFCNHSNINVADTAKKLVQKWIDRFTSSAPPSPATTGKKLSDISLAREKLRENYAKHRAEKDAKRAVILDPSARRDRSRVSSFGRFSTSNRSKSQPSTLSRMRKSSHPRSNSEKYGVNSSFRSKSSTLSRSSIPRGGVQSIPTKRLHNGKQNTSTEPGSLNAYLLSKMPEKERHPQNEAPLQRPIKRGNTSTTSNGSSFAKQSESREKDSMPLTPSQKQALERKEFLSKKYKPIRQTPSLGEPPAPTISTSSKSTSEVNQWLQSLEVDMSRYTSVFLDDGFDNMALIKKISKDDLERLVPKIPHRRIILDGVSTLRNEKESSKMNKKYNRKDYEDDDDLDDDNDSFIVSDDEDDSVVAHEKYYAKNYSKEIQKMLGRGKKRFYDSDDSESSNMEASYDEIRAEERRTARIAKYEDERELELERKRNMKKR